MSLINILNMTVLDNPSTFLNPLQFEVTFECTDVLEEDIEWRVIYVGSAESSSHDQILDELLVGPVPVGVNKFILQTDAPDPSLIPSNDILGITVILVTCSYKDQEFARVGYYVNNEYMPFEGYNEEEHGPPPTAMENLDLSKVCRRIVADKPRVTRFAIKWAGESSKSGSEANETEDELMEGEDDENNYNGMENEFADSQTMFLSPTRDDITSPQNVVSPDATCIKDVFMRT